MPIPVHAILSVAETIKAADYIAAGVTLLSLPCSIRASSLRLKHSSRSGPALSPPPRRASQVDPQFSPRPHLAKLRMRPQSRLRPRLAQAAPHQRPRLPSWLHPRSGRPACHERCRLRRLGRSAATAGSIIAALWHDRRPAFHPKRIARSRPRPWATLQALSVPSRHGRSGRYGSVWSIARSRKNRDTNRDKMTGAWAEIHGQGDTAIPLR